MSYTFAFAMCTVPSLEAGNIAYAHLGFTPHVGGRHTVGTQNSIVPLAQGYLELISFYDEEAGRQSPRRRYIADFIRREGGGLIGFALRTSSIDTDVERLNDAELCYGGPLKAERVTPDGQVLRQRVLRPTPQPCPAILPVLVTGDIVAPAFVENQNTVTAATGISIVSSDAAALVHSYGILLDSEPIDQLVREDLGAVATAFEISGFRLEILEPTGAGAAERTLSRVGSGPVELQLAAADLDVVSRRVGIAVVGDAVTIPPILGAGVRMRVTAASDTEA